MVFKLKLVLLALELKKRTGNVFSSRVQIIPTIKEFIAPSCEQFMPHLSQLNATNGRLSIIPLKVIEM